MENTVDTRTSRYYTWQ